MLYVTRAGIQLIESVLSDSTMNDNGPCGAPNYVRTVSSTATDVASGNRKLIRFVSVCLVSCEQTLCHK